MRKIRASGHVPAKKPFSSQLSLRLSGACLGKPIVFSIKMAQKKGVFSALTAVELPVERAERVDLRDPSLTAGVLPVLIPAAGVAVKKTPFVSTAPMFVPSYKMAQKKWALAFLTCRHPL
jgi:hypothetical protein